MSALHAKLRRDLWRLKAQAATIALLVACAVATLVSSVASYESLRRASERFYRDARFGDLFVRLDRAPRSLLERVRELPGVAAAEGRLSGDFRLELPGATEAVLGHLVTLPRGDAALDQVRVLAGRLPAPESPGEALVGEALAQAWGLQPGDGLTAVVDGRKVALRVAGVATSPEFIYLLPRTGLFDARHYGVLWLEGEALARAMGRRGEFNDLVLTLAEGADGKEVARRVDALLEPFGGLGTLERPEQASARLVASKVAQQRKLAVSLPLFFLAVSAFLLNVVLARLVGTQREQIATLKALGFRTSELLAHYLQLAAAVCLAGVVLGVGLGVLLGRGMLAVYARFFKFPDLAFHLEWWAVLAGAAVALGASLLGAFLAVRHTLQVPPAEAMRPEPPAGFGPTPLERLGVHRLLGTAARMVVRDLERRPLRLLLSTLSVSLATAVMGLGPLALDSIEETLRLHFEVSHREDLTVTFDRPLPARALLELAQLPGVRTVEGERVVPVRLTAGPAARTVSLTGLPPGSELHRVLGVDRRPLALPPGGLALSRVLGDWLGVRAGDAVEVEVLEGRRQRLTLPVAALVDDLIGLGAYLDRPALERLLGETPLATQALLAVDRGAVDEATWRLRQLPRVAAVSRPDADRALLGAQVTDIYFALEVMLAVMAAAIAVGVVYNNARIALEVRSRDLATLRILGFTRGELATVLLGEEAVQVVLGLGPGLLLGLGLGALSTRLLDRELLRVAPTVNLGAQVTSVCVVLLAALVSALLVRRQSDRLDLVAVLKARD